MKINWKNVAAVLLLIGGGVGFSIAAVRSSAKSDSSSIATMSESSMASMASEMGSLEMHSNGTDSRSNDKAMSMVGAMNPAMDGAKMSETSMANTMSQTMTEKSMTPSMGSSKMVDGEQMAVVPKM